MDRIIGIDYGRKRIGIAVSDPLRIFASPLETVQSAKIIEYLENYATTHKHFSFRSLLEAQSSKVEVIVTFLAILELMKTGKILISQEHIFDDIQIDSKIAA